MLNLIQGMKAIEGHLERRLAKRAGCSLLWAFHVCGSQGPKTTTFWRTTGVPVAKRFPFPGFLNLCLHMCVCMCIYIYIYVYVEVSACVYIHICIYVRTCKFVHTCMCAYTFIYAWNSVSHWLQAVTLTSILPFLERFQRWSSVFLPFPVGAYRRVICNMRPP